MNRKAFDILRNEAYARICKISDTKGHDYSGQEDALRNFKTNGEALGITPMQVWGVLCIKHWDAVMTFLREGDVKSEPVEGRIDDVILYLFLLQALIKEEKIARAKQQITVQQVDPGGNSTMIVGDSPGARTASVWPSRKPKA
jgi:hypothetical protein